MRFLTSAVLVLISAISAIADEIQFADVVRASLVFRDDIDASRRYPHVLKVFLRLDNTHNSEVSWGANVVQNIEAELLDAEGKPVPAPPSAGSVQSNLGQFHLPSGSRLDWLITHGGISMMADATDKYALIIGGRGWLIPVESVGSYFLRVRLHGHVGTSVLRRELRGQPKLLLALPPAKLEISK